MPPRSSATFSYSLILLCPCNGWWPYLSSKAFAQLESFSKTGEKVI